MTDIYNQSDSSAYSYTSIKYYCSNCRRPFSQLCLGNPSSPARCPRCDSLSNPMPQSSRPSNSRPTQSQPNSGSRNQNRPSNNSNNSHTYVPQPFVDPYGRVFFQNVRVPNEPQPQRTQNTYRNNLNNTNNPFSQFFGNFYQDQYFPGFDPFGGFGFESAMQSNAFGPIYEVDEAVIEEFLRNDPNEHGPPPASQEVMSKLKEMKFDKSTKMEEEETHCPICQDEFQQDEQLLKLPCDHSYHRQCVNAWLVKHNSCPVCRKSI